MARKSKPVTVRMVASRDFDYVTAGRVYSVTVRKDGKFADFRRADDDMTGTMVPMWMYRREVVASNLQVAS